jgi:hypothetical protein
MQDPEMKRKLAFHALWKKENDRWSKVVNDIGAVVQNRRACFRIVALIENPARGTLRAGPVPCSTSLQVRRHRRSMLLPFAFPPAVS